MSSLRVLFKWWYGFGWKRIFASWVVMLTFVFVTEDLYVFIYLATRWTDGFLLTSYLVAAAILQCLWSISLAFVDIYALLVKRSLRNARAVCIFTIGDGITGTLTLGAACASAGITVLIGNDLNICAENHCASFETATAMAFISWFALAPSCILNFWSMASRWEI